MGSLSNDVVVQSPTPDLREIMSKSRLYGPSHYKSSFEQVRKAVDPRCFHLTEL